MDNLTHGLLGLAIGALRRPDSQGGPFSETDRAVLWACVIAAELPDLDTLWPSATPVLQALQAHRGPTHALLAAPLVAGIATAGVKLFFRGARVGPMLAFSTLATVFAHLLADAWTGWGTRLFLPFSDVRWRLDWTSVIDPLVTVPLLGGAVWAWRRRQQWRRAILIGAAVAAGYVAARVAARALVMHGLGREYPSAERIEVFPSPLNPLRWRFVVATRSELIAGSQLPGGAPGTEAVHPRRLPQLPAVVADNETVRESLAWARLPLVSYAPRAGSGHEVRISDLRYHWSGAPTLTFRVLLDERGEVQHSELERRIPGR